MGKTEVMAWGEGGGLGGGWGWAGGSGDDIKSPGNSPVLSNTTIKHIKRYSFSFFTPLLLGFFILRVRLSKSIDMEAPLRVKVPSGESPGL